MGEEKKEFIKEKIVKKTGAGKGFRNFIKIIVGAILFGVIAAGVFVVSKPTAEKLLGTEPETTTAEVVVIPRDVYEESVKAAELEEESGEKFTQPEETEKDTAASDGETPEESTTQAETEDVKVIVESAIEEYQYTIDDLNGMWKNLSLLCNELDPSIVKVTTLHEEPELFSVTGDMGDEYSGIIIAETYNEMMILTLADAVPDSDTIQVTWVNGNSQQARLRKTDEQTGLAVISAKKSEMSEVTRAIAKPINLGNSYAIARGDLMIAMGSPRGAVHSTDYAWVSYIDKNVETTDGTCRYYYINNYLDSTRGTWALNVKGELVGWVASGSEGNVITGISDYKSLIERMTNASDYAYIGLTPVAVSDSAEATESTRIPDGIYVVEVVNGDPAYEAGILPGDIITKINDTELHTVAEYSLLLESLHPGDEVPVEVRREARGEYRKLDYTLTVGKR